MSNSGGFKVAADLTGMTFGKLTAIRRVESYKGKARWECLCSCGNTTVKLASLLKSGVAIQCERCIAVAKGFEDLTGTRFGRLTCIKHLGGGKWECKCDCGTTTMVQAGNLKSGHIKSCGCLRAEQVKNMVIDISGQRFGRLTAIRYVGDHRWECLCDCGNITYVHRTLLVNGGTRSCGCLKKEWRSIAEEEYNQFLKDAYNVKTQTTARGVVRGIEVDIYIREKQLALEFNGAYWHSCSMRPKEYHLNKTRKCFADGIRLIHIWEDEAKDETAIKNLLHGILAPVKSEKTLIAELVASYSVKELLSKYYLGSQIDGTEDIYIGIRNEEGQTVAAMCATTKSEYSGEACIAIHGFVCNYYEVNGERVLKVGIEKLREKYPSMRIKVGVEVQKFTGSTYISLGFRATELTAPKKVIHKSQGKEFECWDCGTMVCILDAKNTGDSVQQGVGV